MANSGKQEWIEERRGGGFENGVTLSQYPIDIAKTGDIFDEDSLSALKSRARQLRR